MDIDIVSIANPDHLQLDGRMIFTADRSVLYVSVPKTGCTTIKILIAGAAGLLDPAADDFDTIGTNIHAQWMQRALKWSDLSARQRRAMIYTRRTFRFTSVREPYERTVSCYLSKVAKETSQSKLRAAMLARGDTTLLGFLRFIRDQPALERDKHCRRQVDLCSWGKIAYDFVVRYETFTADLETVIARLNIPNLRIPTRDMKHATNAAEHMQALLGPAERALIREIYAADFEAFRYPLGDRWRDEDEAV